MIAVGCYQIIIRPRGRDRAADDRFLPDVKMAKAAEFLRLILLARALLETPHEKHERERFDLVALLRLRHTAGLHRAQRGGAGGGAVNLYGVGKRPAAQSAIAAMGGTFESQVEPEVMARPVTIR